MVCVSVRFHCMPPSASPAAAAAAARAACAAVAASALALALVAAALALAAAAAAASAAAVGNAGAQAAAAAAVARSGLVSPCRLAHAQRKKAAGLKRVKLQYKMRGEESGRTLGCKGEDER